MCRMRQQFSVPKKKTTNGNLYRVWRCGKATLEGKLHTDAKGDTMGCDVGRQVREDVALDILRRSVQTVQVDPDSVIQNLKHTL